MGHPTAKAKANCKGKSQLQWQKKPNCKGNKLQAD